MLTTQDWLDAGYRRYDSRNVKYADFLLQKRFDDTEGKKYYIDVWAYDNRQFEFYRNNPALSPWSYQPEVQFQRQEEMTLNITFLMNKDSTIFDIEKEVEAMWVFLGKPHYEKWEDYK